MKRLLIVSLRKGCGATTVTANLAQTLVKINKQVLVVDLSEENLLRFHLGLTLSERDGWAARMLAEEPFIEAGYQSPLGVSFLPFGQLNDQQRATFSKVGGDVMSQLGNTLLQVEQEEQWQLYHGELELLESPAGRDLIDSMDRVFVVLNAEAMSYATLQSQLQRNPIIAELLGSNKMRFLLNKYQPETEVGRDFMLVLKNELQSALAPVYLHLDTALLESAANLTTVQHHSASSQAAKDFQSLAFWCVSALSNPSY
ncbi:cellulose biosynthesis protein BcsQ [Vibrio sinaloensis]|uniref:cellulose biosynthesis protein BcsQ n=1 Tax=Photobacterium sp. (strain ATCC 43367) TaxID=379097 RepID=UPI0035F03631